jgi:ABC transporter substrate binding protein (PQQ-dependent alcohol dehydrogenase system)
MTNSLRVALAALTLLVLTHSSAWVQETTPRTVSIAYVDRVDDPAYQSSAGYTGVLRKDRSSPFPAAELAIKDGAATGRAIGVTFAIFRVSLKDGEDALVAVQAAVKRSDVAAVILDLSSEDVVRIAAALKKEPVALLNARHRSDDLRLATCDSGLFHTMPSWSMLQDGLAQTLLELNWRRVLVLQGPRDDDRIVAKAFETSAKKFGLRIAEVRRFEPGSDPRKRYQTNVRLLTGNADYDAVFIADTDGEFARYVPYNTARARPIVGTTGLVPSAWHLYWERHGAPQLNRRFARATNRPMSDEDWATWAAVRGVIDATLLKRATTPADVRVALLYPDLKVELYKGFSGSFRPWSRQLRQAILLGTHDAVIALAPVEGALHQKNNLDTLGPDEPEFRCPRQ